ncbi:MAG: TrkH family potassium uptake protein [Oscillospiraceae bacterium]|jgi:trk system potassium uptake protein TrkH|nr:TrkH family potassium uptake protein [Oscillospiraceae bacterium]
MNNALSRSLGGYYPKVLFFIAIVTAAPLLMLPFFPKEIDEVPAFLIPAVLAALAGVTAARVSKGKTEKEIPRVWQSPLKNGSLPVLFAWCAAIAAGAAPFVISGRLDILHALFEASAGWTTAGLSVADVSALPNVFLFHRALMQYCGGLGFIIIIAIVLQGRQMVSMYSAEGHPEGFMPNLRRMSVTIFLIYTVCLSLGTLLYALFGMPLFEALCHAMSAISTAGFSTREGNIGAFDSVPIEMVTVFLMLIGASNFAWLLLLAKGRFHRVAKISEVRLMFGVLAAFIPLVAFSLIAHHGKGFWDGLHNAVFCVVSMLSTTGYSIENYGAWPPMAFGLIMLLTALGASTGSTAGGIKLLRVYILARVTKANIRRRLSPSHSVRLMRYTRAQGEAPIDDNLLRDTVEFLFVYFAVLLAGTLLISFFEEGGVALTDALFEFNAALGTSGVSSGLTARASGGTLIVEMLGMLMGRLEIFIVLLGLYSVFDKVRKKLLTNKAV